MYTHAEKIKSNDAKLEGQTSFNDWYDAIKDHAKSVKVTTGAHAIGPLYTPTPLLPASLCSPHATLTPPTLCNNHPPHNTRTHPNTCLPS